MYFVAELNTLPVGPLLDKFGPTCVTVISVIFTILPHAGLGILAVTEPFEHNELLIYFLFLLGGIYFYSILVCVYVCVCVCVCAFQQSIKLNPVSIDTVHPV